MKPQKLDSLTKVVNDVLFAHLRLLKFTLNEKQDIENFEEWIEKHEKLVEEQTKATQQLNEMGFFFNFNTLETIVK